MWCRELVKVKIPPVALELSVPPRNIRSAMNGDDNVLWYPLCNQLLLCKLEVW